MKEKLEEPSNGVPTGEQLEQLNRFARRPLKAEEVYVFPLVLCDNAIDRDMERFPAASLCKLAGLFEGKTGIFDHDPQGRNQTARVFDTQVVEDLDRQEVEGEPYTQLKAWAYMVRTPENEGLILEIDGGIKKEVSVGCSVKRICCSICGQDLRAGRCEHQLGRVYQVEGQERTCHRLLLEPTDAYEWSFVAVPAQRHAGVTKGYGERALPELQKALESGALFSAKAARDYALRLDVLEEQAKLGREYEEQLRKDFVRAAQLAQPELDRGLLTAVCKRLTAQELKDWTHAYLRLANRQLPLQTQLSPMAREERENIAPYKF